MESTPWQLQGESRHAGIEGKQAARQRLQGGLILSQTVAGSGDEGGPEALATQGELGNVRVGQVGNWLSSNIDAGPISRHANIGLECASFHLLDFYSIRKKRLAAPKPSLRSVL